MAQTALRIRKRLEDPGADALQILGFQDVVGRVELNAFIGIGEVRIGGEQDHAAVLRLEPDLPSQLKAAHVRHLDIGDQQLDRIFAAQLQGLMSAVGCVYLQLQRRILFQDASDGIDDVRLVVHNQNLKNHASFSPILSFTISPPRSLTDNSTPPCVP